MKENKIVESLTRVDFSELNFPLVTIYEKPQDFPRDCVARVWDGKGPRPTNTVIVRDSIEEIREDIMAAGFQTRFPRAEDDDPNIVETWAVNLVSGFVSEFSDDCDGCPEWMPGDEIFDGYCNTGFCVYDDAPEDLKL